MGKLGITYTEEFKRQIVELISSGKTVSAIEREYKVTKTTIREWVKWYSNWYNNIRIHGSLDYLTPAEWHNLA